MLLGKEIKSEFVGSMNFGPYGQANCNNVSWNVVITNQRRSRREETIDGGKILFLHVMLNGETTARFKDGKWIKKPSIFRDKPSKEMVDYLLKIYN